MKTKTAASAATTSKAKNVFSIAENTVLISLDFSSFGITRTINSGDIVDAKETDPAFVKAQKVLLDSPEYAAIKSCDNSIKAYLKSRALPSFFKSGTFLLPVALVDEVDSVLTDWRKYRRDLVDAFKSVYIEQKNKAKESLGPRFSEADYPSAEGMATYFGFRWSYVTLQTPQSLAGVSQEIFEREQKKAEQQWKEAYIEIQGLMRAQLLEMVSHMQDRLTPKEDGTRKVFHASLIEKVGDFLEVFDARNVTNDAQLKSLVDRARDMLEGVDADLLKDNDRIRNRLAKGMAEIKEQLGELIVDAPKRAIATDASVDL